MQTATARLERAIPTHTSRWGPQRSCDLHGAGTVGGDEPPVGVPVHERAGTDRASLDRCRPAVARALPEHQPERCRPRVDLDVDGRGVGPGRRRVGRARGGSSRRDRPRLARRRARQHDPVDVEAVADGGRDAVRPHAEGHGFARLRRTAGADAQGHGLAVDLEQVVPARDHRRRGAETSGDRGSRTVATTPNVRATGSSKRRSRIASSSWRSRPGRSRRSRVSTTSRLWSTSRSPTRSSRSTGRRTTSATADVAEGELRQAHGRQRGRIGVPPPRRPRRARTTRTARGTAPPGLGPPASPARARPRSAPRRRGRRGPS